MMTPGRLFPLLSLAALVLIAAGAAPRGVHAQIKDELASPAPLGQKAPLLFGGTRRAAREGDAPAEIPIGEMQKAWEKPCDEVKQAAPGIKHVAYARQKVYCIDSRANMQTSLFFPAWEEIVDIALGDGQSFIVSKYASGEMRRKALLISPTGITGADTNLTVIGKSAGPKARWDARDGGRNIYTFILRSWPHDSKRTTDLSVFVVDPTTERELESDEDNEPGPPVGPGAAADRPPDFRTAASGSKGAGGAKKPPGATPKVPQNSPKAAASETPDWLRNIPINMGKMRFSDYEVYAKDDASAQIAPERVFHDGAWTFLDFGENGRSDRIARAMVSRVMDGVDNPVNWNITGPVGNIVAIHGVGDFTFKNGDRVVCVRFRREMPPPVDVRIGVPPPRKDYPSPSGGKSEGKDGQ